MNDSTTTPQPASPSPTDGATQIVPPWSCPPWCGQRLPHGFEVRSDGDVSRTHELEVSVTSVFDLRIERDTEITVSICQDETVLDNGAGGITREAPFVWLTSADAHLTAQQARQIGAALGAAAERLGDIDAEATR